MLRPVFVPIHRLLLRTRHARSRADELAELGARMRAARRAPATAEEHQAATDLRALKVRAADALAGGESCRTCAKGKPASRGVFAGGDCCSGETSELFSDDELAALVQAGTTFAAMRAPRTEHAGCAFRGSTGCTLDVEHRPARCVHYACGTLRRELIARGTRATVEPLLVELHAAMQRFVALRGRTS